MQDEGPKNSNNSLKDLINLFSEGPTAQTDLSQTLNQALGPSDPETQVPAPFIKTLVLQGGGAKGGAYPGFVQKLDDFGMLEELSTVTGSSAGAITAMLLAFGLDGKQFAEISEKNNFLDLMDVRKSDYGYTVAGNALKIMADVLYYGGAYTGNNFHNWAQSMCEQLLGDPNATFRDLAEKAKDNPALKNLVVTGTNIDNSGSPVLTIFSAQNLDTQDVCIADAVRASMSFPGAFEPFVVRKKNEKGELVNLGRFVDGGASNNYPIDKMNKSPYSDPAYDYNQEKGKNPAVFGATLCSGSSLCDWVTPIEERLKTTMKPGQLQKNQKNIAAVQNSGWDVFNVLWYNKFGIVTRPEYIDTKTLEYENNTVQIYNEGVSPLDFGTSKKEQLVQNGSYAMQAWAEAKLSPMHTAPQGINRKPVELTELLYEFYMELERYNNKLPNYNPQEIQNNVRLKYLQGEINKFGSEQINSALEKVKLKILEDIRKIHSHRNKIQGLISDQPLFEDLKKLLINNKESADKFARLFKAQLSKSISLLDLKDEQGKTLLDLAIKNNCPAQLNTMLGYVRETIHQLEQHGRHAEIIAVPQNTFFLI